MKMSELALNIITLVALYSVIFASLGVVIFVTIKLAKMKDDK